MLYLSCTPAEVKAVICRPAGMARSLFELHAGGGEDAAVAEDVKLSVAEDIDDAVLVVLIFTFGNVNSIEEAEQPEWYAVAKPYLCVINGKITVRNIFYLLRVSGHIRRYPQSSLRCKDTAFQRNSQIKMQILSFQYENIAKNLSFKYKNVVQILSFQS